MQEMVSEIYDSLSFKNSTIENTSPQEVIIRLKQQIKLQAICIQTLKLQIGSLKKNLRISQINIKHISKKALGHIVLLLKQQKRIQQLEEQLINIKQQRLRDMNKVNQQCQKQDSFAKLGQGLQTEQIENQQQNQIQLEQQEAEKAFSEIEKLAKKESQRPQMINFSCRFPVQTRDNEQKYYKYLRNGTNYEEMEIAKLWFLNRKKSQVQIDNQIEDHLITFIIERNKNIQNEKQKEKQIKSSLKEEQTRLISIIDNFNFQLQHQSWPLCQLF